MENEDQIPCIDCEELFEPIYLDEQWRCSDCRSEAEKEKQHQQGLRSNHLASIL